MIGHAGVIFLDFQANGFMNWDGVVVGKFERHCLNSVNPSLCNSLCVYIGLLASIR